MTQARAIAAVRHPRVLPVLGFGLILIGGLYDVKWQPYLDRAYLAAAHHGIGRSILGAGAGPGWRAGFAYSATYMKAVWKALVLGLAVAAGVQVLLPRRWIVGLFSGGRRARSWATAAALPSMMCTCCAAPIAVGMIESEADAAAAIAYWLANPVLNPATLVFIGFVLGWDWALLRLVLGVILVFGLSALASRLLPRPVILPAGPAIDGDGPRRSHVGAWLLACWRLAIRLVPEYLVLLFALGAVRAWLFPALTPALGHAAWLAPLLAAAGTAFVIPTAGEVPIVQTLQHAGLGDAGAAALLMTLPAVSLPSLAMLARVVPLRVVSLLAAGTFGIGLLAAGMACACIG